MVKLLFRIFKKKVEIKSFKKLFPVFIFRVEVDSEVASKRLKSTNVYYSMKIVVQTKSFIHQEISEG